MYSIELELHGNVQMGFFLGPMGPIIHERPRNDRMGLTLKVPFTSPTKLVRESILRGAEKEGWGWIAFVPGMGWRLDLDGLRSQFPLLDKMPWLRGSVLVEPYEYESTLYPGSTTTFGNVQFEITEELVLQQTSREIFLSHKGVNKVEVYGYFDTLKMLGFDPWLDKEAMVAGTNLHRAIQEGFERSCAAVFFLTPDFKDEKWLKNEIDWALAEKTKRGDAFAIIPLVFEGPNGERGIVPKPLEVYLYAHPKDQLEALREILRALPIHVGPVAWRTGK